MLKKGYYFFLFTTFVIVVQFMKYIFDSQILGIMDFMGWTFYVTSCISHAACIAIITFIIYSLFLLIRLPRLGSIVAITVSVLLSSLIHVNEQVYQLYRFHINGFILNMITGPAAAEIFTFDAVLYAKYILSFCLIAALYIFGWALCTGRINVLTEYRKKTTARRIVTLSVAIIISSTLYAHLYHIYASFMQKQSVVLSERLLPYYFPTTSYRFMTENLGIEAPINSNVNIDKDGDMVYPIKKIETARIEKDKRPNILIILLDSWNTRALTPECMPNIYQYANDNLWFTNHFGCSNGTRSSVFGIWFGIPSYYWKMAEMNHITPVILDVARENGYEFHNYPGAPQYDPPFGRVIFSKEKNVRLKTEGKTCLDRDIKITEDFISDLKNRKSTDAPTISFLFYDLPHGFELPKEKLNHFQPSWEFADYSVLNNDMDPTPFWNLYRNTCFEADILVGKVLKALKETGAEENTYIIISGDHGQEFNENKKNYWGHNGNFSQPQVGVPLIAHFPGREATKYTHRTTHYDIVPTLMHNVFGVKNPESDYSMGYQLTDTRSRDWHVVGSDLNYGFILKGDTILEKTAEGRLDVFDAKMNIIQDYKINMKSFNSAVERLNHFIRK